MSIDDWRRVGPAAHTAHYRIDGLDLPGLGRIDDIGRAWELTGEKGWHTPAAPRTAREIRASGHGSYRGVAWRGDKIMSVSGTVHFDDPALREPTLLELGGLCSDPGRLYVLRRTAGPVDQVRSVELDGEPDIEPVGGWDIDFQFTFAAPDPRKLEYAWQDRSCSPASSATIQGLDYSEAGLDHTGAGLDYGTDTAAIPGVASVANWGSAPVGPLLRLSGPFAAGQRVVHRESGCELTWNVEIAPGERWWVNCDEHAQTHPLSPTLQPHEAWSNTRGPVTPLLRVSPDWPVIDPSSAATFQLAASGDATSELTVCTRSAWF